MIEYLSKGEAAAVMDLASLAEMLKIRLMLVGANARRLSFDIPFGFASPRTTVDWDFAVSMTSWEEFAAFYEAAVRSAEARFRAGDTAQRIIHVATGILMDLVPFGRLSEKDGTIRWPQTGQAMSVLGFEEAYESCAQEELPHGLRIGIVTPALQAALKFMAYSDRGRTETRDLQDLWFILERYARPPANEARVFDELAEFFPDASYYEHMDSLLLGWDIGRRCRAATLAAMSRVIKELATEGSSQIEPLLPRISDQEHRVALRGKIMEAFVWLGKGIELASMHKDSSEHK